MACLGLQIGSSTTRRVSVSGRIPEDTNCQTRHSFVEFRDDRRRRCRSLSVCSASAVSTRRLALSEVKSANDRKMPINLPQLDNLMKQSVTEIVKNISEAPFLVHVYSENQSNDSEEHSLNNNTELKLQIERATTESWPFIRQRWEGGNSAAPDGVILVEELSSEEEALLETEKEEIASSNASAVCNSSQRSATKVWGLLVQGRGGNCPSCYILKTCRVQCCSGFSTHFCLAKVDCFGKSAEFHLNRMWLQR